MLRFVLLMAAVAALSGCESKTSTLEEFNTKTVTFPNGQKIQAELMMSPNEVMRGMKHRDRLDPGKGMLFVHGKEGRYAYWMHEVRIPLDMVWMNRNREIVEVFHNAQPCPGPKDQCGVHGGHYDALFVLELAAGMIDKYGLAVGQRLDF